MLGFSFSISNLKSDLVAAKDFAVKAYREGTPESAVKAVGSGVKKGLSGGIKKGAETIQFMKNKKAEYEAFKSFMEYYKTQNQESCEVVKEG